jgi:hypothetical protein
MFHKCNGFHDLHNGHVDLQNAVDLQQNGHADLQQNGHVDFQQNGYVDFGQWLGQVDPRRPVHCALKLGGLKRGRKGHCMKKPFRYCYVLRHIFAQHLNKQQQFRSSFLFLRTCSCFYCSLLGVWKQQQQQSHEPDNISQNRGRFCQIV